MLMKPMTAMHKLWKHLLHTATAWSRAYGLLQALKPEAIVLKRERNSEDNLAYVAEMKHHDQRLIMIFG